MTKKHVKYWLIGGGSLLGIFLLVKWVQARGAASAAAIKNQQLASAKAPAAPAGVGTVGSTAGVPLLTSGGTVPLYAPLSYQVGLANPDPADATIQVNAPITPSQGVLAGQ